ncbi:MAG: hypothetical protein A2Z36_02560 [Chloroflexi bacterium RBG_19FT_COMBO_48_23]|nr:MAG: hypothetical protein A2Z36_02560 [Chloroflexi bacterium RBG_19FT_COMBO_48_23]
MKKAIYSGRTEFQSVEIVDTRSFGVCLVLDGKIQSSERDEFIYHEALVHPAMLSHACPEMVFIAGGGEGATLREVLTHKTVKRVVMVDIDKQVIDICRRYLSVLHRGSFDDSRLELHFADARRYLQETKDKFDVVIIDLVEPLEEGPACLLYTQEFYQLVKERMNVGGIVCIQSGASGWTNLQNFTAIINTLKSVFAIVCPYQVYVPSFVDLWGFTTASQTINPAELLPGEVDRRIAARMLRKPISHDGLTHQSSFTLPKHIRHQVAITKRIITDKNPVFVH